MAKKSHIARQERRKLIVAKYAEKRKELKEKGDYEALSKLPRDSSATRLCNLVALLSLGSFDNAS